MRTGLLLLILLKSGIFALSQNLVPNPSFEDYHYIPYNLDEFEALKIWRNPTDRTPDYLHRFNTNPTNDRAKLPDCAWGWQYAHSGDACIALHTWVWFLDYQQIEYAQVTLDSALELGHEYEGSVWVQRGNYTEMSTNCQGILLTEKPFMDEGFVTGYTPQINNLNIIRDTQNWTLVTGRFIADKPYKVLTLGNFYGDQAPFDTIHEPLGEVIVRSTYFWDDVRLVRTGRKIDFTYTVNTDCLPAVLNLSVPDFDGAASWEWAWNDGTKQSGQHITRRFEKNDAYSVTLKIVVKGHTFTVEKPILITLPQTPVAAFDIDTEKRIEDKSISFDNESKNAIHYRWDFGDGTQSTEENPEHAFSKHGNYILTLWVENESGCRDSIQKSIYIACKPKILSNSFTPNQDGHNDVFPFDSIVVCEGPYSIKIFNRWGNLIYQSDDPYSPWKGEGAPVGTYYYVIRYKGGDEGGFIELLRE